MPSLARRSPSVWRAREALRRGGRVGGRDRSAACAVEEGVGWLAGCSAAGGGSRRPFLRDAECPEVGDVVRQAGRCPHRARRAVAKHGHLGAVGPPRTGGMQDSAKNGAGWRLVGRRRRCGRVDRRSATTSFPGHELSEGRSTYESCALSFWVDALWRSGARSMSEGFGMYCRGERCSAPSVHACRSRSSMHFSHLVAAALQPRAR